MKNVVRLALRHHVHSLGLSPVQQYAVLVSVVSNSGEMQNRKELPNQCVHWSPKEESAEEA